MQVFLRKAAAWVVVGFIALVFVFFARPMYRQGEPSIAGQTAEDFPTDIYGHSGHLSDLRGKVVVLNFWASWCPPCIEETPSLIQLQKHLDSRNAVILGVSIDEDPFAYEKFLKEYGFNFPTFREPTRKVALDYGTPVIPDTYIIDRRGKILRKFYGAQQWDSPEMLAYLDSILGKS